MAFKKIGVDFFTSDEEPISKDFLVMNGPGLYAFITRAWRDIMKSKYISTIYVNIGGVDAVLAPGLFDFAALPSKISSYCGLQLCVLPYGGGISGHFSQKTAICRIEVTSDIPFADWMTGMYTLAELSPDDYLFVRKEAQDNPSPFSILKFRDFFDCLRARRSKTHEPLGFVLVYALQRHSAYSTIIAPQIIPFLHFPGFPAFHKLKANYHASLTAVEPPSLSVAINSVRGFAEGSSEWTKTVFLGVEMLQNLSQVVAPSSEFNEATRRMVTDVFVNLAVSFLRKTILSFQRGVSVEDDLYSAAMEKYPEIVGHGPLDYCLESHVISVSKNDEPGNDRSMSDNPDLEESSEKGKCSDTLEVEVENGNLPFTDLEAKVKLGDQSLFRVLAQMNDIVYVDVDDDDDVHVGCKRVREVFRDAADKKHVKPVRNEVIGILSTGHTYEVYTLKVNSDLMKEVRYLGKKQIEVLRYLKPTGRVSSFTISRPEDTVMIDENKVKEILLLFIAVLSNKLNG
jgi:hypothetical protein